MTCMKKDKVFSFVNIYHVLVGTLLEGDILEVNREEVRSIRVWTGLGGPFNAEIRTTFE